MIGRLKYALIDSSAVGSLLFAIPCLLIAAVKALFLITSFSNDVVTTAVVQDVKDHCWLERSTSVILGVNFDNHMPECGESENEKSLRPHIRLTRTYQRVILATINESSVNFRQVVIRTPFTYAPQPPVPVGSVVTVSHGIKGLYDQNNMQHVDLHLGYGRDLTWIAFWLCLGSFLLWSWRVLRRKVRQLDGRDLTRLQQILMRDAEDWQRLEPRALRKNDPVTSQHLNRGRVSRASSR